jgi:threonine dehydrogenase-like Zn-dependent dehydrogenase
MPARAATSLRRNLGTRRQERPAGSKYGPGRVFDLTFPLEEAADAYRAMDERRAVKVPLRP